MSWQPPDWLLPLFRPFLRLGLWLGRLLDWLRGKEQRAMGKILRIGVVGDLSLQDPQRLWKCLSAACSSCDVVVQVGDCHPGYDQMKQALAIMRERAYLPVKYASSSPREVYEECESRANGSFLAVPGNHDINWDAKLGWPRTWYRAYNYPDGSPCCYLVGLDNSQDKFSESTWSVLGSVPADGLPLLIFVHKPLGPRILLPSGDESNHTMQETGPNADAERLKAWVLDRCAVNREVVLVHGHYHGWSYFVPDYCSGCLVEGRGGAAPELGWTSVIITDGMLTMHRMDL